MLAVPNVHGRRACSRRAGVLAVTVYGKNQFSAFMCTRLRKLIAHPSGELGPEKAKKFRDTGKDGGEEHTQKCAECAERSSQIHVLVVSAENGGKQLSQPRISRPVSGVIPERWPSRENRV